MYTICVRSNLSPDGFPWAILFRAGGNSWCSYCNWMRTTLKILRWEKIVLPRRPKWACVPMKSHCSRQSRPEILHRPFVCFWHRDKAHKKLGDSYVSSALERLSPTRIVSLFPFVLFGFSHLLPPDLDTKRVCTAAHWRDSGVCILALPAFLGWRAEISV